MNRLIAILKKEFIQMRRDRLTLGMMLLLPVFQLIIFGFAVNTDVKHLKTAVFDQSQTMESRELLNGLAACEYFDLEYYAGSNIEINEMVDAGKVMDIAVLDHVIMGSPGYVSLKEKGVI